MFLPIIPEASLYSMIIWELGNKWSMVLKYVMKAVICLCVLPEESINRFFLPVAEVFTAGEKHMVLP